jgi:hypothetical protein
MQCLEKEPGQRPRAEDVMRALTAYERQRRRDASLVANR